MSTAAPDGFRRLGASFATGGERYERLRPSYPAAIVDWLVNAVVAGGRVADVGCGTGKLTALLADRGFDVVAVDPSEDMLAQLRRRRSDVGTQLGTGEGTGLPTNSVDLVTFAQSWHWVDPAAGAAEVARVLRPGGSVAMVWNFLDVRIDWVAELAAAWHTLSNAESVDATRQQPDLGSAFGRLTSASVDWLAPMSRDDLAALVTTRSYYLTASSVERQEVSRRVDHILAARFGRAATIDLPYRTHAYRAQSRS